ncbi:uncharacterized protein N7482_000776 [Penicillium canariense]|uniref:Zn(2)-C6 fungal-type domain-containing protein n=1 Tax=Penicillium canariense TaxID=189055 RepID=A0A9W9IES9_9EURO|nr:uncharacterized protein N7482_000776 [Penicillium canariense]KAJ5174899.1 hypothetical protein N7482_000776 [Penicillium canariense]
MGDHNLSITPPAEVPLAEDPFWGYLSDVLTVPGPPPDDPTCAVCPTSLVPIDFMNPSHALSPTSGAPTLVAPLTSPDKADSAPTTNASNPAGEDDAQSSLKRRRTRHSPERDYSQEVIAHNRKRRRTGQACDRCKVRKFRCDPRLDGCINCYLAGLECKVTDLVTTDTSVRGAARRMAVEIKCLQDRVAALEQENEQLRADLYQKTRQSLPTASTLSPSGRKAPVQLEYVELRSELPSLTDGEQLYNAYSFITAQVGKTLPFASNDKDQKLVR